MEKQKEKYTSPALTVTDIIQHHIGDLQWRYEQDGGGEEGLKFVNFGTCGTPEFATEKEFHEYIKEAGNLRT